MRKILFGALALMASASVAAAEVTFSGSGRFGMVISGATDDKNTVGEKALPLGPISGGTNDGKTNVGPGADESVGSLRLETRLRLDIHGSVHDDNGIEYVGRFRLQGDDKNIGLRDKPTDGIQAGTVSSARLGLRTDNMDLDVGNTGGTVDNLPNYYGYEPGLTALTGQYAAVDAAFPGSPSDGSTDPGMFANYKLGANRLHLSMHRADVSKAGDAFVPAIGLGANRMIGKQELGFAFHAQEDSSLIAFTGARQFGRFGVKGLFAIDADNKVETNQTDVAKDQNDKIDRVILAKEAEALDGPAFGVSGQFDVTPKLGIVFAFGAGGGEGDGSAFGLGGVYSLGKGVSLKGGFASVTPKDTYYNDNTVNGLDDKVSGVKKDPAADAQTKLDFGVAFSF